MSALPMTEGTTMTTRKTIPIKQATIVQEEQVEDRLLREGWRRQTTIGEPRLSEIAENYRAMGYEVHVESWQTEGDGCTTCLDEDQATGKVLGTVYTRRSSSAAPQDELF
jgi:hypothetical protein